MSFRVSVWVIAGATLILSACEPTKTAKSADPPRQAVAPTLSKPTAPASAPKIQETLVPKSDPVQSVIDQAEKQFQSGQANYQAGHLDQAKTNFDHAFDVLLSYPAGVKSDDRLEDEFDKIVEAVNAL
jgi:membrane-bound lytic murein transglycosylase D